MSGFDSISDALPSPRDDEPPNLRQDILDELGDHLECALRREQLTGGNAGAEERVVDRFGDPQAVANKLWRDALWEKIMSQRLMLGLCAAMLVVCCAALGITAVWLNRQEQLFNTWQASSEARMKEQSELFTKLLANSEASSRDLSEQMQASLKAAEAAAAKSQPFSEWNPVELKFVTDGPDSRPVSGVEVQLYSFGSNGQNMPSVQKTSDEHGVARFERVKFGNISAHYHLKQTDKTGYWQNDTLPISPGEAFQRTVVCPAPRPRPQPVRVTVDWPEELRLYRPALALDDSFELSSERAGRWFFDFSIAPGASPLQQTDSDADFGGFAGNREVKCATLRTADEVEITTVQKISSVSGADPSPMDRDIVRFFKDYPLVDVSNRDAYSKLLQWPGPEFRMGKTIVLLESTTAPIAKAFRSPTRVPQTVRGWSLKGFGFAQYSTDNDEGIQRLDRSLLAIPVDLTEWNYTLDKGEPAQLRLTPSAAAAKRLRYAAARIEGMLDKLAKDAEQRQAEADKKIAAWEAAAPARAAEAKRKAPFSEWNPVEFRFTEETPDGPPVKNLQVSFYTEGKEKNDFPTVQTKTDEQGRVKLDRVRYGNYGVGVESADRVFSNYSVTILPGEGLTKSFVVPRPVQPTKVVLKMNWPKEMADRSSAVLITGGNFLRTINPGQGADVVNFRYGFPTWETVVAGRDKSIFVLPDIRTGYVSGSFLGISLLNNLQFLDDSTQRPADGVPWPGPEWRLWSVSVMIPLSREATAKAAALCKKPENAQLFGVSDSMNIDSWDQQWQPTTPPTVVLTPNPAGEKQLLEWMKRVEQADRRLQDRETPSTNR